MKKLFRKYKAIKKVINYKFFKSYANSLLQLLQWANQKHINIIEKKLGINSINNPSNYESLIPSENADKNNKYSEALKVALQTPKVNNIAITGSYGSGKSSFLRTFEKNNNGWVYLPISLATFKDEQINNEDVDTKYERNQQIEKSILQQIFYREEERKIPSSRFKRIKNIKSYELGLHVGLLLVLGVVGLFLYIPTYIKKLFLITELPNLNEIVLLLSFFIGSGYFIYQLSKYLMNLQVSKLSLKDGEIELGNKEKTSILNEHLDEILYFFEVTDYNVVVLEDLDRFGNTEIFIKLRELNTLINNSKEIGRRVVFIYAIKDEMFKDKDRTKFFDFILPIIPYINPSNSLEKIKVKFKNELLDPDFLSDIALYIDDMRLLVNIYNEFMIYKHKLVSGELDKNKLLAMIIYKNLYPSDFSLLHFNDGSVYKLFNNKTNLIQHQINEKQKFIDAIEVKIKNIKNEAITNIAELKMIYLCKLASKLSVTHYKIDAVGEYQVLGSLVDDPLFDILIHSDNVFGYVYGYSRSVGRLDYEHKATIKFQDIENEINQEYRYEDRKQFIEDKTNNKIELLRESIEKIESEIDEIKSFTLQEVIRSAKEDIFGEEFADKDILKLFIKDGKVDENYHDYISYFFEESITLNDREFLLSVKNNRSLDYTYRLTKIEELLKRLKNRDFETSAILNFDLMNFLLDNSELHNNLLEKLLLKLSDESNESIKFIFELISHVDNSHRKKLAPLIWSKFWWYIIKESDFSDKKKDEYFDFLFQNLEVEKLIEFNIGNTLKDFIENKDQLSDFDVVRNEKYEKLYNALKVKYRFICNQRDNLSLFRSIYENDHYQINVEMVNKMVLLNTGQEKEIEEKLKYAHYTTLKEPNLPLRKLLEYVDKNINEYIENVFLIIKTNTQESEKSFLELLNHASVSSENKIAIIQKEEMKITDISKVSEKAIWDELLKTNKIVPNWDNLLYYYQEKNEIDDILINFFNQEENYVELSKIKMKNEAVFTKVKLGEFSREILLSNNITDDAYDFIVRGIWFWKYEDIEIKTLTPKKVDILLKNTKLALTQGNIDKLQEYFPNKVILLIEHFNREFIEKDTQFTLNDDDEKKVLKSSKFTNEEKISIIEKMNLTHIGDEELINNIILIYMNSSREIPILLYDKLFEGAVPEDSVKILTFQIPYLEGQKITDCLNMLDSPYRDLTEKSAKILRLDNNELNRNLVNALIQKSLISPKSDLDGKTIKVIRSRKGK